MYCKVTNTNIKINEGGNILNAITGVRIGVVQMIATDKCRRKYSNGNPIGVIKLWLN